MHNQTPTQPFQAASVRVQSAYVHGAWHRMGLYQRDALTPGAWLEGPGIIEETTATSLIPPGWRAEVLGDGTLVLRRHGQDVAP